MDDKRIIEIKTRCDAASEGPWKTGKDDFTKNHIEAKDRSVIIVRRMDDFNMFGYNCLPVEQTFANAAFIAAARQDIPDLLAEVERLRAENKRLERQVMQLAEAEQKRARESLIEARLAKGWITSIQGGRHE